MTAPTSWGVLVGNDALVYAQLFDLHLHVATLQWTARSSITSPMPTSQSRKEHLGGTDYVISPVLALATQKHTSVRRGFTAHDSLCAVTHPSASRFPYYVLFTVALH